MILASIAIVFVLLAVTYVLGDHPVQDDPVEGPDTDERPCPYCIPCTCCGGVEDDDECLHHDAFNCGATDDEGAR